MKNFSEEFKKKFGINGNPTNCVTMKPPATRARLTDAKGKQIRKNAEKSIEICEWWVELVTSVGEWVLDLFAGTSSMGMTCIKTGRLYQGCEIEQDVCWRALERLALFYHAFSRGDMRHFLKQRIPGITPSIACQVDFIFFFFFFLLFGFLFFGLVSG